jgi:ATP-dependent DNA helicase RecG
MQNENLVTEYKSLKKVTSGDAGFKDLSATCVSLANAQGGTIYIGIEDKESAPPSAQKIKEDIINSTITRLRSLCFNVGKQLNDIETHPNGGQFFSLKILPCLKSIATTSDGKIFIRVGDQCQPVRSDDVVRLASEKDAFQWELQNRKLEVSEDTNRKLESFANEIRQSDRVKQFVKDLTNSEIAEHYHLIHDGFLTNLGVLWLGNSVQRSSLAYPLTVQYIVYDENERKIRKESWNDNQLNPKELLLEIEKQAVELTYFHEFPQGLFREKVPHYDQRVIRELLINAIAHKSYTISGDIFIKVYVDRIEITNPGGLPLGITKNNILHSSNRRNPLLIRLLHDLKLMEGEGSGYDLIYEISGRDSKPFPDVYSDFDSTTVTQYSRILDKESVLLIDFISKSYQLTQKEFIAIGIIARHKKILATQLSKELQLSDEDRLRSYVSRLLNEAIIVSRGIKKGTEYLLNPQLIASSHISVKPTLITIEPHRLKALIIEDLTRYPKSRILEIAKRLPDVTVMDLRKCIYKMVNEGELFHEGGKTYRRYYLAKKG